MTDRLLRPALATLALLATVAFGMPTTAQDGASDGSAAGLPTADALIAKMLEASGGKEALAKLKNRVVSGKFSMPAMGMEAPLTMYMAPGSLYVEIELEGMGKITQGLHDGVAWTVDPMMGARIMEGAERAAMLREAELAPLLAVKKNYKEMAVTGVTKRGDQDAYKLKMVPREGAPEYWYVSRATHLVLAVDATHESPMGSIEVKSEVKEYKDVDGVKLPWKTEVDQAMQKFTITMDKIEHNVEIPASRWDFPGDIKALLEKKKGKGKDEGKKEGEKVGL